jgi:N-acetylglutamate synthase-like GNAT family acetyltransferase
VNKKKLTTKTKEKTLLAILDVHKSCVLKTNSKTYSSEIIKEWLSTLSLENIKEQLKNSSWVVIEENDEVLAFAQYSLKDKEIYQIQVKPEKQNQGFGKKLFEYLEKDFKKNNTKSITLFSTLDAVSFYEKLGFEKTKNIQFPLKKQSLKMVEIKKKF